jgi:hypothetical protein
VAGGCSARSARRLVHRVPAERAGERRRPGEIELLMTHPYRDHSAGR